MTTAAIDKRINEAGDSVIFVDKDVVLTKAEIQRMREAYRCVVLEYNGSNPRIA